MFPTSHLLAFALISFVLIIVAGPNVLFVISRSLMLGRAAGVGTAGRLGTIWCMPFRDHDYEQRPWVANSGWPLAPADLAGYEELAAESFGFAPFGPPKPAVLPKPAVV